MIDSLEDIERIVVTNRNGIPVHVSDVAKVRYGSAKRFGAMTIDGKGECVGGIAMMLKGANANVVTTELENWKNGWHRYRRCCRKVSASSRT